MLMYLLAALVFTGVGLVGAVLCLTVKEIIFTKENGIINAEENLKFCGLIAYRKAYYRDTQPPKIGEYKHEFKVRDEDTDTSTDHTIIKYTVTIASQDGELRPLNQLFSIMPASVAQDSSLKAKHKTKLNQHNTSISGSYKVSHTDKLEVALSQVQAVMAAANRPPYQSRLRNSISKNAWAVLLVICISCLIAAGYCAYHALKMSYS